ncbi:MAG TPA: TetR/AcrR family transcriptional regulator [Anaerolineales bacterium]|nr:TetR/AcrR family transcriptional regulator [Anaerolineales bacterium]
MQKEKLKKGDVTRLVIEDAALELYMEQGYHATSMRQIADKADLALGGIYNHFKSKEEIFEAIIIDKHPYKKILPTILATEAVNIEEFLRNTMRIVIKELGSEPYYMKLLLVELIEFNGRHGASLLKLIAPQVLPVFERLIKSRKNLRITNPAMLMRSFFGMILSYFLTGMLISDSIIEKLMPKDAADIYVDIFLQGILKSEV